MHLASCSPAKLSSSICNTVAILAQGTQWAIAAMQAFSVLVKAVSVAACDRYIFGGQRAQKRDVGLRAPVASSSRRSVRVRAPAREPAPAHHTNAGQHDPSPPTPSPIPNDQKHRHNQRIEPRTATTANFKFSSPQLRPPRPSTPQTNIYIYRSLLGCLDGWLAGWRAGCLLDWLLGCPYLPATQPQHTKTIPARAQCNILRKKKT
jgi:hypothetical protein